MSAVAVRNGVPKVAVALTVNGQSIKAEVEPRQHLADFVRDTLDLTGTHLGCEHGVCGACTVLVDGEPARACLTFAATCQGAAVTTIEGLDDDEIAAELRAAFNREHALQCGYCTPGMLVSARDLVLRLSEADDRRVRLGLSGNLCRCTGYVGIVRAITSVIAARRERGLAPVSGAPQRGCGPVGAHPRPADAGSAVTVNSVAAPVGAQGSRTVAADFTPAHRFEQSFVIDCPPEAVFAAFGRITEVAACIPGAMIDAQPSPDHVEGGIKVKLGPISATFRGSALIERVEHQREGRILGKGADAGDRSTVQGEIRYRVSPGPDSKQATVSLTIGYTLKGPLAQFGRPGLVRDVARRMGADFAVNFEEHLKDRSVAPRSAQLNVARFVTALVRDRVLAWLRRRRLRG